MTSKTKDSWKLEEWNGRYSSSELPPMTKEEISVAVKYLRDSNYSKPSDCSEAQCPVYRPACTLGVCRIAVGMCGDF